MRAFGGTGARASLSRRCAAAALPPLTTQIEIQRAVTEDATIKVDEATITKNAVKATSLRRLPLAAMVSCRARIHTRNEAWW